MSHTKGPWKVINADLSNRKLHQIIGPVCVKNEISLDDCNLIAAAPELLAALEIAIDVLAHCKADIGYSKMQTMAAIAINDAIAKAKGE